MTIQSELEAQFSAQGLNPQMAMEGLKHLKPINYWEYTAVDSLLTLQKPRTHFPDEYIFIVYHQITELVFNLMLHELKQLCAETTPPVEAFKEKIPRLSNYTRMLSNSFNVMTKGMNYDQYNTFRHSLSPASGFQSAQYRLIEIYCTQLQNLARTAPAESSVAEKFGHIYWQHAGLDRTTGKKTFTLRQFEEKYLNKFIETASAIELNTLEDKINQLIANGQMDDETKAAAREFDHLYNVSWPLVHLETAQHYLNAKGENKAATGGSEWQKYLHPRYQKRIFFPALWTEEEKNNWGDF
ncbi:MAG: tryptophan 2,3-dioxygenase [Bacteroidia bacterium]|nr:tryptophan 2,3-dioxygenase [Bacteroidia bacterium]